MEYTTEQWREALQRCTPMGSEFTTPEACVQFVEEERTRKAQVIVRLKRERDEARDEIDKMKHWIHTEKNLLCALYGQLGNLDDKHDEQSFVAHTLNKIRDLLDQFSPWIKEYKQIESSTTSRQGGAHART